MTRRQKIIVISIVSFLVLVLGVFVFLLLNRKTDTSQGDVTDDFVTDEISEEETSLASDVVPTQETTDPVFVFTYRNNALYYVDIAGALWKKDGAEPQRVGEFTVQDPNLLFNSPDGAWLLVGEGAVSTQKRFSLISTRENTTIPMPQGVREIRFLNNNELIYYKDTLGATGIFIYDLTKRKERLVTSLSPLDAHIRLINKNLLMVAEKPTNGLTNLVFSLNLEKKELKNYFSSFLGSSFAVVGENKVLAFTQNPKDEDLNKLYNLVLLDESGKITHSLDIITMPEKCAADSKGIYLYCAVPMEWSKNMPNLDLPDDYYMQKTDFTEKMYRIDLITFTADEITPNAAVEDAIYPSINEDGSKLYYYNRKDQLVYSLVLPPAE